MTIISNGHFVVHQLGSLEPGPIRFRYYFDGVDAPEYMRVMYGGKECLRPVSHYERVDGVTSAIPVLFPDEISYISGGITYIEIPGRQVEDL